MPLQKTVLLTRGDGFVQWNEVTGFKSHLALKIATICGTIVPGVRSLGKLEKLLQKIKNNPRQVRFEELDKILTRAGFERRQSRGGSSHYYYTKGPLKISIPYRQPYILTSYVVAVIKLLERMGEDD